MIAISTDDEFIALERVQACAGNPSLWQDALRYAEQSLHSKIYMLEFNEQKRHTGRYCNPTKAIDVIAFLESLRTEANQTVLEFLLDEAVLNYPYCKAQLSTKPIGCPVALSAMTIAPWPGLITPVYRSSEKTILLGCFWPEISIADADSNALIGPFRRFTRAVSSTIALLNRYSEACDHRDVLETMIFRHNKDALCLIDANLSVLYVTEACKDILASGQLFTITDNRLSATRRDLDSALQAVSRKSSPKQNQKANRLSGTVGQSVLVPDGDNGLNHISILPLNASHTEASQEETDFILVQIKQPSRLQPEVKPLLQSAFGLSNGEARLAFDLAVTGSLPETLSNLDITRNTAKTHLRRIYEKTSTQSQVELIQLLNSLNGLFS